MDRAFRNQSTTVCSGMRETLPEILKRRVADGVLRADPRQATVAEKLEALRAWLEAQPGRKPGLLGRLYRAPAVPKGLYLWGGVGGGKSMLMDIFAGEVAIEKKRRVHFHAFMQEVHRAMHAARKTGVEDALAPFAEAQVTALRLLAFDEMQITDIADAMIVGRLFEKLMAGGVLIVTTSNRPPEDLYKNGLSRESFLPFIDMLRQRMEVMELEPPRDYRLDKLAGAEVYFHPVGKATGRIAEIWRELTEGVTPISLHLEVNGRDLELSRYVDGMARASFWELCGQPLGPADYLAIAGALRVLIVEGIPRLSSENYNEAKRFVTLVDALYEAKVRLVCSAADVPERLYIEGEGTFEFARTASRLREMQAADWGEPRPPA